MKVASQERTRIELIEQENAKIEYVDATVQDERVVDIDLRQSPMKAEQFGRNIVERVVVGRAVLLVAESFDLIDRVACPLGEIAQNVGRQRVEYLHERQPHRHVADVDVLQKDLVQIQRMRLAFRSLDRNVDALQVRELLTRRQVHRQRQARTFVVRCGHGGGQL